MYPGSRVMAEVFRGGAGMIVRIDAVSPSPARLGPDTEVELHKADTTVSERVIGLADVGGADGVIRRLRELVELPLLRPGFYRRLGVRPPKGVLLYGPPGTGKTLTCKALANELGVTAFKMSSTELVGSVTGETEANLRLLFSRALAHAPVARDDRRVRRHRDQSRAARVAERRPRREPVADADGRSRRGRRRRARGHHQPHTGDRPGVPQARPVRGGDLHRARPTRPAGYEILSIHTREMPLSASAQEALGDIAAKTGGFVGADLMHLARSAGLGATQRLAPRKSGLRGGRLRWRTLSSQSKRKTSENALKVVRPSVLRDVVTRAERTTWPEIVGLDTREDACARVGEPGSHDHLASPTLKESCSTVLPARASRRVAHAIVAELGVNFVSIEGSRRVQPMVG